MMIKLIQISSKILKSCDTIRSIPLWANKKIIGNWKNDDDDDDDDDDDGDDDNEFFLRNGGPTKDVQTYF